MRREARIRGCPALRATLALLLLSSAARAESAPPAPDTSSAVPASAATTDGSPTPDFFDVNKFRADPHNPGAIHIPGTNVAIYIGGFAQLDVIYDANVIGNPDQFLVSSIPVGGGTGNTGSELSARQSRVFVETDAPWSVAPLLAYVEVDFFDPQNQGDLHLRHAFGAIGRPDGVRFVGGQTWTAFMDATVLPSQLDYAGPVGVQYVGGVLQVYPNKRFMTGFEYLFGERENRDGQTGRDNRLQVSTQVTF